MYGSTFEPLEEKSEKRLLQSPIDHFIDARDTLSSALCDSFKKPESHLNTGSKFLQSHSGTVSLSENVR
jgi:hypothetical protein